MNYFLYMTQVPEGRLFGLDQQTLIQIGIYLINAIILCFVLGRLLYKPVKKFLAERQERITSELKKAEAKEDEANRLIEEYEAKLAEIQTERTRILKEAEQTACEQAQRILDEAKAEAEVIKEKQIGKHQAEAQRVQDELRLQVIDFSTLMAEKLLHDEIDENTRRAYTDRIAAALEENRG